MKYRVVCNVVLEVNDVCIESAIEKAKDMICDKVGSAVENVTPLSALTIMHYEVE